MRAHRRHLRLALVAAENVARKDAKARPDRAVAASLYRHLGGDMRGIAAQLYRAVAGFDRVGRGFVALVAVGHACPRH